MSISNYIITWDLKDSLRSKPFALHVSPLADPGSIYIIVYGLMIIIIIIIITVTSEYRSKNTEALNTKEFNPKTCPLPKNLLYSGIIPICNHHSPDK